MTREIIHASCVALDGRGVLLAGDSGVGKSDVALRLMDEGGQLVADDQTELFLEGAALMARAPQPIVGLMEIRHVGLFRVPFLVSTPVHLFVDLIKPDLSLVRYPEPEALLLLDQTVPRLRLKAHESSTPSKIRAFLKYERIE